MKIFNMKTNKITKDFILESIEKQAKIYARKAEIYDDIKALNEELKNLQENSPVASFGFIASNDAFGRNKNGFVAGPNISYIAQLESEMNSNNINEENLLEIDELRKENESLKKEIEDLKKKK